MLRGSVARPQLRSSMVSAPRQPCAGAGLCQVLSNNPGASRRSPGWNSRVWERNGLCAIFSWGPSTPSEHLQQVRGRAGHSQKRTSMVRPVSKPLTPNLRGCGTGTSPSPSSRGENRAPGTHHRTDTGCQELFWGQPSSRALCPRSHHPPEHHGARARGWGLTWKTSPLTVAPPFWKPARRKKKGRER